MIRLRSTVLLALIVLVRGIGVAGDLPILKPGDLPKATIIKTDYYPGKALFGYVDGGAELYLEYGFEKLARQEIRYANETLVAEIYQMKSAYEAYGIFSIQRFKCVPIDSASPNTCQSRYQLQADVGSYYVSIVSESGSPAAQRASIEIYKSIKGKISPQEVPLPQLFRNVELRDHLRRLTVICGTLGIQNGYTEWESLFQGIPRFSLTFVPIEVGTEHLTIAHIRFLTTRDQMEFCRLSGFNDVKTRVIEKGESGGIMRFLNRENDREVLFLEASTSFPNRGAFVNLLAE